MADKATRRLRVWRGDSSGGGLTDYTVPVHEGEVVLDVLHRLQTVQVPDLTIRWNCKAGKCGSCSAEVNGRLCQDVCHVIRDHEGNKPAYAGPRYFIRHAELDLHPLDARDRRAVLREEQGLGLCNITKCCTEVCPAGIKITDNAIIPMKERSADQRYDPLGRAWRRREDRPRQGDENL